MSILSFFSFENLTLDAQKSFYQYILLTNKRLNSQHADLIVGLIVHGLYSLKKDDMKTSKGF